MYRMLAQFCLLLCFTDFSHATPVITNVIGTLVDGGTVSVSGSGFGNQGPTIAIYDNFEGGTAGLDVDPLAVVGTWAGYNPRKPTYDNISYSGNLSMRVHAGDSPPNSRIIKANFPPATEIFISYWLQIPIGHTFPGSERLDKLPTRSFPEVIAGGISTWKLVWMFDGDNETQDNDVVLPTYVDGDIFVSGNNTDRILPAIRLTSSGTTTVPITDQIDSIFRFGEWVRITVWLKANDGVADPLGPGTSKWTYDIPTANISQTRSSTNPVFTDSPPYGPQPPYRWTHINITGFTGNGSNDWSLTRPLFDDVYLATGAGAQARTEICEAPLHSDCEKFGFITVDPTTVSTDWTDSTISGTIRKGALSATEVRTAYVYVYDENGQVNAAGFPICPSCPRPPTNLQAN